MDYSDLEKYDPDKMHKVYDNWPQIARDAYQSNLEPIEFKNIEHIVFSGMGGSGAIGDLFSAILSKIDIHVDVVKGYLLPKTINSNTLVVTTSISGNTNETLTTLASAKNLNCKVIGFSSGGKLENFCKTNNLTYRNIPLIHSPRTSFVNFVYGMLKTLGPILPIEKNDINESINNLKNRSSEISSINLSKNNPAISIAQFIDDIPCIYYPSGLSAAAIRFKNSLQENSKMHVIIEDVIETCHNGIVSWEKKSKIKPILIEGKDDFIKTKERWNIIKEYFNKNQIEFLEVNSVDGSVLTKLTDLVYLLDYASIYRSVLSQINPSTVKSIDFIKEKLSSF